MTNYLINGLNLVKNHLLTQLNVKCMPRKMGNYVWMDLVVSLKLWARQDNPEEYSKIIKEDIYTHIMAATKNKKGNPVDVAKVIHVMYKDYFVLVSVKDNLGITLMKRKLLET